MAEYMWSPFEELRRMEERLSTMLGGARGLERMEMPRVDVQERGNDVVVTADMPGIDKKDIKISVRSGNILEISARKTMEKEEKEKGFTRRERGFTGYYRSIALPSPVDQSKARATYNNGVLEITLPMTEQAKASGIPIS